MARGRLLSSKVKEERAFIKLRLEEAQRSRTQELKFRDKNWVKIQKVKLQDWVSDPDNAIKLVAIGGIALTLKNGIDWTEEVLKKGSLLSWIADPFLGIFRGWLPQPAETPTDPQEISEWIISISVAYLIVMHFGELVRGLGTATGSVLSLGRMILGVS